MSFELDPRLGADTFAIADLALSRVLLMNDARFPWALLVPRRAGLVEIADLDSAERTVLMEEIARASVALSAEAGVEKINFGALGNIVRQLHVHVVGRSFGDSAWPGPVWGTGPARPYDSAERDAVLARLRRQLSAPAP